MEFLFSIYGSYYVAVLCVSNDIQLEKQSHKLEWIKARGWHWTTTEAT